MAHFTPPYPKGWIFTWVRGYFSGPPCRGVEIFLVTPQIHHPPPPPRPLLKRLPLPKSYFCDIPSLGQRVLFVLIGSLGIGE